MVEGSKALIVRCIRCNDSNHKCGTYWLCKDAIKSGIITFKVGKIINNTINELLKTNFEKISMKKFMEDILERVNSSCDKEVETFAIKVEYNKVWISIHISREVIMKGE